MKRWVILVGMMIGTVGCRSSTPSTADPATAPPTQQLGDFEMQDIQNGMKSMTLHAKVGKLYDEKNVADLDSPLMTFFKMGKKTSTLRAPFGQIDTITHDVRAWGGVTIVSADSSTLTTDRLHYSAKTQNIHSDDPVHIQKPDSYSDGIGLDTDPELNTVRIGHQTVHFHHAQSAS